MRTSTPHRLGTAACGVHPETEVAVAVTDRAVPFAALLRQHRLEAGLTQAALAGRAALSVLTVQSLEAGLG